MSNRLFPIIATLLAIASSGLFGGVTSKYTICSEPFFAISKEINLGDTFQFLGKSNSKVPFTASLPVRILTPTYLTLLSLKSNTLSIIAVVTSGTMSR